MGGFHGGRPSGGEVQYVNEIMVEAGWVTVLISFFLSLFVCVSAQTCRCSLALLCSWGGVVRGQTKAWSFKIFCLVNYNAWQIYKELSLELEIFLVMKRLMRTREFNLRVIGVSSSEGPPPWGFLWMGALSRRL